jgi:translation initiation factor IF-3
MPTSAALEAAQEAGLDLVEVSPNADPPVCKILDYGKFRFQEQKKKNEARKSRRSSRSRRSSSGPTSTTTITM